MNSWWIHPRFLAAHAVAARGDADLPDGVHLRLLPSKAVGLALSPMPVWTVPAWPLDPLPGMAWFDRRGRPWTSGVLDDAGGEAFGWFSGSLPDGLRLLAVEAGFANGEGEIALLDRIDDRLLCRRSRASHMVGAPVITRVRLRGRGPVQLRGWVINEMNVTERVVGGAPLLRLSAPIGGDRYWYAGGEGPDRAMRRVEEAAPLRFTPPDRPLAPWGPLPRAAEVQRLQALRAELDEDLEQMLRDPGVPPRDAVRTETWLPGVLASGRPRAWQQARIGRLEGLLAQAMDPGVARYLGLMAPLREAPGELGLACIAGGLFALGPEMATELAPPDAFEQRLIARLSHMDGAAGDVDQTARRCGLTVRALLTAAAATPLPDALPAPDLALGTALWQREDEGPSWRFRQQLRVNAPPLLAQVALARKAADGADFESRHGVIDTADGGDPALPSQRARAMLLGTSTALNQPRAGVLSDGGIPVAGAPWTYRVALADLFGRWGEGAEIDVPVPRRPEVPAPVLRLHFDAEPTMPAGDPEVSPGTLRVWVQVPGVADLTAGSRPLARVEVVCNGQPLEQPAPREGGELGFSFAAPALGRGGRVALDVSATFFDDANQPGPAARASTTVHDPRPPRAVPAGIGLLWTSRPGPSTEVDAVLTLRGEPGLGWRVYQSEPRGLGLAEQVDGRDRTRAELAVAGAQMGLEGRGERAAFRLLTEAPVKAAADGSLRFQLLLPRALQTVQFLRFVPLDAQGREAPFGSCPLVPVAVPSDRRPPAPRVFAEVDAATGLVRVTVQATGLDRVALHAAEPGLFTQPPAADARAPQVRLRRAAGTVPQPLYARAVGERPALLAADGDMFETEFGAADLPTPLPAYVRVYFWAELRMPPERRLPWGLAEIALPSGAVQTEPPEPGRSDAPGAWSEASAPAMAIHVPVEVPTLDAAAVNLWLGAGMQPGHWRAELAITGGPRVAAQAVGGFSVQVHLQEPDGEWEVVPGLVALTEGALVWAVERPGPVAPGLRVALQLRDPVGRWAAPRVVEAVVQ